MSDDSPKPGPSKEPEGAAGGTSGDSKLAALLAEELAKGGVLVEPLPWCPHLTPEHLSSPPPSSIDPSAPCVSCSNVGENWLCLRCRQVYCSRYINGHMREHGAASEHSLSLSLYDLSVWCYTCDDYVDNDAVRPHIDVLHREKFGEPLPPKAADPVAMFEVNLAEEEKGKSKE